MACPVASSLCGRFMTFIRASFPPLIRDRRKIQFDEGAGIASEDVGWTALFEQAVSDLEFQDGKKQFAGFEIASKEEFFYLRALSRSMDVNRVSHLKSRTRLYVPGKIPRRCPKR